MTPSPALRAAARAAAFVAALAGTACLALPAAAQGLRQCGARDAMVQRLAVAYGEARQAIGLGSNNSLVEVFASPETGTWTITVTSPDGVMCLLAAGQAYEAMNDDLAALLDRDA